MSQSNGSERHSESHTVVHGNGNEREESRPPQLSPRPVPESPPTPRKFFRLFRHRFLRECRGTHTELARAHRRSLLRPAIRESDGGVSWSKEWTAVMSTFLARLAVDFNCWQAWEAEGQVDCVWYPHKSFSHPLVLIEHEQQRYGPKSPPVHVDRLRRSAHDQDSWPLSVAIEYEWSRPRAESWLAEDLRARDENRLRKGRRSFGGPFLLIVGGHEEWTGDSDDPYPWRAFVWNRPRLRPLSATPCWKDAHPSE